MTNTTIGEQLRKARLAQNLDLSLIADETKISKYYLEAIEANQIERLPGLFFYKSFVRQYSKLLKVDGKKLEAQINSEQGVPEVTIGEPKAPSSFREPALRAANSVSGDLRLVLASVGLIAVLVGGSMIYTWLQRPSALPAAAVAEVKPAYVAPPVNQPSAQQPSAATLPVGPDQAGLRQVVDNLTPEAGPDSSVSLSLSATEPTWITITSDGKTVYTGVLEPSQSKLLAGKQRVMIKVGNAAGLEVKWNGKAIGRIGDAKQVRTILFTDKDYQIMKPPPPPGSADPVSS